MRPAPLERKHSKVGTPRPSKHAPVVNQPSEAGSFRSRSYGEYQQKRHPDGHTGILETSGAGTGFIPAWILRPRLGRILQEAPQRRLYPGRPARRAGRTWDRGARISGVLTNFELSRGEKNAQ